MSQENVEVVRQAFEAFERGDVSGMVKDVDPEAIATAEAGVPGEFHGPEGFLQALAEWTEGFDQFKATAGEFTEASDCVIVRVHQSAQGQGSGVPVEADFWFVVKLREGKLVRLDIITSEKQALEAAGLRER
jgi:ketosteroid isomerase-like protein